MKKKAIIQWKICLVLTGVIILMVLGIRHLGKEKWNQQAEGYYILKTDVIRMAQALSDTLDISAVLKESSETAYVTFKEYEELLTYLGIPMEEITLKNSYQPDYYMTMEDWLGSYQVALHHFQMQEIIVQKEILLIASSQEIVFSDGRSMSADEVYTTDGIYQYADIDISGLKFQKLRTFVKEQSILFVADVLENEYVMENAWLLQADNESMTCYHEGAEIYLEDGKLAIGKQEQVADIVFKDGIVVRVDTKEEKINGKLLRVSAESVEIEGYGSLPLSPNVEVYRLFGAMEPQTIKNLVVGYDFVDFVVENNMVEACLITRNDTMENIRVLIRTNDFADIYHDELQLTATTEYEISYGDQKETYSAGELFSVNKDSECFQNGQRVYILPKALTGEIILTSLKRTQGEPGYRGTLELVMGENGILAVNELLLEEYLYAVVPSEMPSSYPLEALKAQAICARSYAYCQMLEAGENAYGAHVDDSTAYQVYNNIEENPISTRAVKETSGQVVMFENNVIYTYYFSTSCGYTTNGEVWKGNETQNKAYLAGRHVGEGENDAGKMVEEEAFAQYISKINPDDHESNESLYRWSGKVDIKDLGDVTQRLRQRYEVNPSLILTKTGTGSYESIPVEELGTIEAIEVEKRNEGGVIEELCITGSKNTVKVITEYNVRFVLSPTGKELERANKEPYVCGSLLPSAYFTIQPLIVDGRLQSIMLTGGGYGHGAGMSQNGAKALAEQGMLSGDIIQYFYKDIEVKDVYLP